MDGVDGVDELLLLLDDVYFDCDISELRAQCCRLDSPPADKTKRARGREKERHIPPADSQQRDDEDSGCSFVPHP